MLSRDARERLVVALADETTGQEVANAIDAGANSAQLVAANVAEIADPATATAEDAANKINEVIQALIAAGLMEA